MFIQHLVYIHEYTRVIESLLEREKEIDGIS